MRLPTIALLAASAGLCVAMTALPDTQSHPPSAPTKQPQPIAEDGMPFDFSFDGGTLADYFDALGQIAIVNVVALDDVRALTMPAVRLRGVTSGAAVSLVGRMFQDPVTGVILISHIPGDGAAPIYILRLLHSQIPQDHATPINDIFSIGDVLRPANEEPTDLQVKKLFEMIDSAITLAPAETAPEMAFHDATNMLVFRGSLEQRRLIEAVLERYNTSWRQASAQAEALRHDLVDLELEARTASIEAEATRSRVEHLDRRRAEVQAAVQEGAAANVELALADDELNTVRAEAEIRLARAAHAQTRLAECVVALSAISPAQQPAVVIYDLRDLGARGERVATAFKALLDAAELPETRLVPASQGTVTLTATPALHETFRFLLNHLRSQARPAGTR